VRRGDQRIACSKQIWPPIAGRRARSTTFYHAHSEALHGVPGWPPVPELRRGHVGAADNDYFAIDVGFIEVYEHGRRLGNAVLLVAHRLSPDSAAAVASSGDLPEFSEGHGRTQEYLRRWLEILAKVRSD
jgi:hypothetical protein